MAYSPKDREEFAIQIKELLDLKVIEPSKLPFSSPTFMFRKEAEKDEDLSKMRTPLQKKLKKDYKWSWSRDDSNYIRKIKNKLKSLPPLYHPHKDDKMIIETDASQDFWGAILKASNEENEEKLGSYASGTFTEAERNYHINEKEILAMKKAITKFRLYIISNKFLVRSASSTCKSFLKCQVKMTDINQQIIDIEEEIEMKELLISTEQKKDRNSRSARGHVELPILSTILGVKRSSRIEA
ncbi:RNA-directed DNA polymerase [Abeliophyllum distichum]|uniref:RNA-directed DNA polymerase n=1 Tax=Abeliophyllum distichum TaxID=126358 RepID=A0ABD1Q8F2_9LAMI